MSTNIPRTDMTSKELHAVEYIAALEKRLDENDGYLEKRLRSIPDMYRQYRLAKSSIGRVLDNLYDTMQPKALNHMLKVCQNSELIFRPKSILNESSDAQVITNKDLELLVGIAINSCCSLCLKTCSEIKQCELRKTLMNVAPLNELSDSSLCGYTNAVGECEMDEML